MAQRRAQRRHGADDGRAARGHLALVEAAQASSATASIVTLFVNPTQFAPTEDLSAYPRDEEADRRKLEALGVDVLFAPPAAEMYPAGFDTTVMVGGPSAGLETDFRPHFFAGVATIVAKLLLAGLPDRAYLRREGFSAAARREEARPRSRHPDRDRRLPDGARSRRPRAVIAQRLSQRGGAGARAEAPRDAAGCRGADTRGRSYRPTLLPPAARALTDAGFAVDYLEVRNAETLAPVADVTTEPLRLLVAAKLGKTRLIDNIAVVDAHVSLKQAKTTSQRARACG